MKIAQKRCINTYTREVGQHLLGALKLEVIEKGRDFVRDGNPGHSLCTRQQKNVGHGHVVIILKEQTQKDGTRVDVHKFKKTSCTHVIE